MMKLHPLCASGEHDFGRWHVYEDGFEMLVEPPFVYKRECQRCAALEFAEDLRTHGRYRYELNAEKFETEYGKEKTAE